MNFSAVYQVVKTIFGHENKYYILYSTTISRLFKVGVVQFYAQKPCSLFWTVIYCFFMWGSFSCFAVRSFRSS